MEQITSLLTSIFGEDFDLAAIFSKIVEYVKSFISSLMGGTTEE